MLRCKDNSIYTGITTDIDRRIKEHFQRGKKCAKYTYTHEASSLEVAWITKDRKSASILEYYIKKLVKKQKEDIILNKNLEKYFNTKIEVNNYILYKNKQEI